jgi:uncharacterized protein with von Willebrand factor type A (vWA) domain
MSPYELLMAGGSVEHWNEEPGQLWLERILRVYDHAVWLNPLPEQYWQETPSLLLIRRLFGDRMYPLTLDGMDAAVSELMR